MKLFYKFITTIRLSIRRSSRRSSISRSGFWETKRMFPGRCFQRCCSSFVQWVTITAFVLHVHLFCADVEQKRSKKSCTFLLSFLLNVFPYVVRFLRKLNNVIVPLISSAPRTLYIPGGGTRIWEVQKFFDNFTSLFLTTKMQALLRSAKPILVYIRLRFDHLFSKYFPLNHL